MLPRVMKTTIAVLLAFTAVALGCQEAYTDYMKCLKGRLDRDYGGFEKEFREDFISLAESCFDGSGQCGFEFEQNYTAAYVLGREGPLKGCRLCNTLARAVRGLLAKATKQQMSCVRAVFREGIAESLEPCIRKDVRDYRTPPKKDIPDFDEAGFEHRNEVLDTTSAMFMVESNMGVCRRRVAAQRAGNRNKRQTGPVRTSRQCLDSRRVDGRRIWGKHCTAMQQCRSPSTVSSSCKQAFVDVERATCGCIESGTNDIVTEINRIGRQLKQVLDNGGDVQGNCERTIHSALDKVKEDIDLDAYFKKLLGCADGISDQLKSNFNIDSLVRLGCRTLANGQGSNGQKAAQLQKVIQLGTQLLNAMVTRVTRFCPGAHCSV